jgi:hypothetical protein
MMKIIFSRKGWDSGYGGAPSPIFPSGKALSMPIPISLASKSFDQITFGNGMLGALAEQLSRGKVLGSTPAHLDPDLDGNALPRLPGWRPCFGQEKSAARHLANEGVGPGDLFLYFGWFRAVEDTDSGWRYVKNAPDLHVLFGWLQIERQWDANDPASTPAWMADHPHLTIQRPFNTIFSATDRLQVPGLEHLPGGGVFPAVLDSHILTGGATRSRWKVPGCFLPSNGPILSYHRQPERWQRDGDHVLLDVVAKGQEFVLDCDAAPGMQDWLKTLFA